MNKDTIESLTALLAQPAAQHQGEPVAPVFVMPSNENSYGFGYVDGTCIQSLRGYRDHLEEIVDSIPEGPIFTHADTGEVERLRNELGEAKGEYDRSANRVAALRAELAERDSLLRNFIEESEQDFVSLATVDRAKAALSASAEPAPTPEGFSAEQMTAQGADGYRNGIKAAAELAADYPELAQAIRDLPLPQ